MPLKFLLRQLSGKHVQQQLIDRLSETEVMRKAAEHAHSAVQQFQAHAEKKIMQQMNQRAAQQSQQQQPPAEPAVIRQLTAQISSKLGQIKEDAKYDWQNVKNKFKQ